PEADLPSRTRAASRDRLDEPPIGFDIRAKTAKFRRQERAVEPRRLESFVGVLGVIAPGLGFRLTRHQGWRDLFSAGDQLVLRGLEVSFKIGHDCIPPYFS